MSPLSTSPITSSSQIISHDLHRILTSGYLNEEKNMGYMKRGGSDHGPSTSKSPQFHRPSNKTFFFIILLARVLC